MLPKYVKEFDLIARLTECLPSNPEVVVGAGDDCAVVRMPEGIAQCVLKTDAVVEGVHFAADTEPERIGHKALARCLSDFGAMGAKPMAALVTLAISHLDPERIEGVYRGMSRLAERFGIAIVGGETTSMPSGFLISVSLMGTVAPGKAILRCGSQVGDALFVTGELGGSIAGKHLDFEPRLVEGQWLAEHFAIHSMIDLSDGLAGDLGHILKQSVVPGAELLAAAIPISRSARLRARAGDLAKPALAGALTDGEDFELLFTVKPSDAVPLLDAWRTRFPETKLTCVGRLIERSGIWLRESSGYRQIAASGFDHFAHSGQAATQTPSCDECPS